MDATCKTCPFFDPLESRPGACTRHAPQSVTLHEDRVVGGHWRAVWPCVDPSWSCGEHPLRQRDRLAATAMQGLLPFGGGNGPDWIANRAYEIADAMLAAASPPSRADNGRGRTRSPTPPAPSAKEDGK